LRCPFRKEIPTECAYEKCQNASKIARQFFDVTGMPRRHGEKGGQANKENDGDYRRLQFNISENWKDHNLRGIKSQSAVRGKAQEL
jgi:hypothetical protein